MNLFEAYLGPRMLAACARSRLRDAIEIVEQLTKALEYERDHQHEGEHKRDNQRLEVALAGLTDLLSNMQNQAARITFEGTLLEEREAKAIT